jgi:hypothetical protein
LVNWIQMSILDYGKESPTTQKQERW